MGLRKENDSEAAANDAAWSFREAGIDVWRLASHEKASIPMIETKSTICAERLVGRRRFSMNACVKLLSSEALEIGDQAPPAHGMTYNNMFFSLDAQAGRPVILIFVGQRPSSEILRLLTAFHKRSSDFAAHEADIIAIFDLSSPNLRDYDIDTTIRVKRVFCDPKIIANWRLEIAGCPVVALDRGMKLAALIDGQGEEAAVSAALNEVAALPVEAPRDIVLPAPILIVPNVLDRDFCRSLIARFEAGPFERGGMASIGADGKPFHKIDAAKKHRYDFVLEATDPWHEPVRAAINRRCVPEIAKAFQVNISDIDRILIARYDDDGGFFLRHRDNAAPSVSFRQFALSINLNAEEYEGGHIVFPEYNSHRYKPRTGSGAIFSCSLLHEACRVTRGMRYVLLTFLHDAKAWQRRAESDA